MKLRTILAAGVAGFASVTSASAGDVAALWGDNTISIVDPAAKKVVKTWKITGVNAQVVGIDVRPADGQLYGVTADGWTVVIDLASGKATPKAKLETVLPDASMATVDFNPVADRLRLMGHDGTNLRVNVDDGKVVKDGTLKFAEKDMHKGEKPNIVAGAYTNSYKGTTETALYDIDATIGALIRQAPPNDGVLNAIGKLGVKADSYAFDIQSDGQRGNAAWLLAGDTLYSVDLASGKATASAKIGGIGGKIRDLAVLPAM